MDEALILLLEKKDFAYITIKDICETAGVNRSTFYLHYENTNELLRETTQYIIDRHFSYYEENGEKIDIKNLNENRKSIFIEPTYLVPYLTFVKENKRVFKVSIKQFDAMNMSCFYDDMFTYVFEPILKSFNVPPSERNYIMKFYLTGVFAIVMEWLGRDCEDSIDLICKIIVDCVMGSREIDEKNN